MDPLTHALLGAASTQALRRQPARVAALAGAAAALLPDIDVFIASEIDPLLQLEFHRQFTHSFVAAPVGAALVAAVLFFATRGRHPPMRLFWPALIGYLSAILLDACTSYGTQILWPFSSERFAASVVAVVDPVVTVALLTGAVLAFRRHSAKPARVAVALVGVYLAFGWLQRERAENLVEAAALERGHSIAEHTIKPTLGNLVLWRSVYRTGDTFVVDAARVGLFSRPALYAGAAVSRVRPNDLVPPLMLGSVQAADVVRFAQVSEGYLARHPSSRTVIGDIRYAMLPDSVEPLWAIEIHPERDHAHVSWRTFRQLDADGRRRFMDMLLGRSNRKS